MAKILVYDYATEPTTGDMVIDAVAGDFAIAESTNQHTQDILVAQPGEYLSDLFLGVGIIDFVMDDEVGDSEIKQVVRRELKRDGQVVDRLLLIDNLTMDLKSYYES